MFTVTRWADDRRAVAMRNMEVGDLGVIVDDKCPTYNGNYVFCVDGPLIVSLDPHRGYWSNCSPLKVQLLNPGEKLTLEVTGGP